MCSRLVFFFEHKLEFLGPNVELEAMKSEFTFLSLSSTACSVFSVRSLNMGVMLKSRSLQCNLFQLEYVSVYYVSVKTRHIYLYSAFNNTNCVKATTQYQHRKIVCK